MESWHEGTPHLSESDVHYLQRFVQLLPYIADICQADVFIDCAVSSDLDCAMVIAEAFPSTARSLYRNSVVGQFAFAANEPGVIACLKTGHPVLGSRGISQEQVEMEQNVIPIKNHFGETIGTLILERDISASVRQEKHVEMLRETTEQLGAALMQLALSEAQLPSLIQEGMLLFDDQGVVNYSNDMACQMLRTLGIQDSFIGVSSQGYYFRSVLTEALEHGGIHFDKWDVGPISLQLKAVAFIKAGRIVGGMLLMKDVSELRQKEKKLLLQSAVIKEIHHRVKNNLQTISSLLNLQSRRLRQPELKGILRESISRINSISLVHEMLAREGLDDMNAAEMMERLAKLFIPGMAKPGQHIHVIVQADTIMLKSDQATHLALVVNELMQNSLTHAFSEATNGTIRMVLQAERDVVTLVFMDDGPGFDSRTHEAFKADDHLGMQIVRVLVEEGLQGSLRFGHEQQGLLTTIMFPLRSGGEA